MTVKAEVFNKSGFPIYLDVDGNPNTPEDEIILGPKTKTIIVFPSQSRVDDVKKQYPSLSIRIKNR